MLIICNACKSIKFNVCSIMVIDIKMLISTIIYK